LPSASRNPTYGRTKGSLRGRKNKFSLNKVSGPSFTRHKHIVVSSSANTRMQINDKLVPTRMIKDSTHRKAPSPPTATETKIALRVRSTTSQDTLHQNEKEMLKGELEKYPRKSEMTSFEVHALRSKVELLEIKLEEMTQKVHVFVTRGFDLCIRCYSGIVIHNDKLHWKIGL
jgi:hypothetical protein